MMTGNRNGALALILALALLAVGAQVSSADSINGSYQRFFYNGTYGTLNLSDGNTYVLTFSDLDFSSFTGSFELYFGDRGPGTGYEKFSLRIEAHANGIGGHRLEAWDRDWSALRSTHDLAAGEGSAPLDIRMIVSQNPDDTWHVIPEFRPGGGAWTLFDGAEFDSDDSFDLTDTMLMIQFGPDGSGTVFYEPPTAPAGTIVCDPDPLYLSEDASVASLDVNYLGGGGGLLYGYSVRFTWDGAVVATDSSAVTEGNLLSDQGTTWFEVHQTGTDEITVDCVLLGSQPGVLGPGTLFSVEFTAQSCDTGIVDVTVLDAVDHNSNSLAGFNDVDALIFSDIVDPVFAVDGPYPDSACTNAPPVIQLSASDPCGALDDAFYRIDGGSWLTDGDLFTDLDQNAWANGAWVLPGFEALAEGNHTVGFFCTDRFDNTAAEVTWSFLKDTIDPSPVADFAAAPGNGKVHLSWTNPVSDLDHVVVVRKAWDATSPYGYPEYAQPAGGYPTGPGDGDVVYTGSAESFDDVVADRSIYFYHTFVYDCAGNVKGGTPPTDSLPAGFAQGSRATNYWLGDVTQSGGGGYDGEVDFFDLNLLSAAYRRYDPDNPPVPPYDELDIGPTDDGTRLGLPVPDDTIEFPELVIFAMNYGVVDASGKTTPLLMLAGGAEAGAPRLRVETSEEGKGTVVARISLRGNDGDIQAAGLLLHYDPSRAEWSETRMSPALAETGAPVFFASGETRPGEVWIDLAALGSGRAIQGTGQIAEAVFRINGGDAPVITLAGADLRGPEGTTLAAEIENDGAGPAADLPAVTRLVGALPSPFNPVTTVRFELAREERVRVRIYDVQGRLVRDLADGAFGAGSHGLPWDGTDGSGRSVSSGTYFVRMQSEGYASASKIVLLR